MINILMLYKMTIEEIAQYYCIALNSIATPSMPWIPGRLANCMNSTGPGVSLVFDRMVR